MIVLTSLTRFTNPFSGCGTVPGISGLHSFSSLDVTEEILKEKPETAEYLCGLTLHGRDTNITFFLDSDYIDTNELDYRVFVKPEWDVVVCQIILYHTTARS